MAEDFRIARFSATSKVNDLPLSVRDALSLQEYPMADAGGDWNAGCVVDGRPGRRLVVGGMSPQVVAVLYEQGGYALHRVLEVIRITPGSGVLERCRYNVTDLAVDDLDKLRAAFPTKFQLDHCDAFGVHAPPRDTSAELEEF